jgi:hypothetical protein
MHECKKSEPPEVSDELKRQDPNIARVGTAYHEAGHAIVGRILGRNLERIDIASDQSQSHDGYGGCLFERQCPLGWTVQDEVTVAYAGGRAEVRIYQKKGWSQDYALMGANNDLLTAIERTARLGVQEQNELFRAALARADELLQENWVVVEVLAAELLIRGTICATELHLSQVDLCLEQLDAVHKRRGISTVTQHGSVEIRSGGLTPFAGRDNTLMIAQSPVAPADSGEDKVVAVAGEHRQSSSLSL